MTDVAPAGWYPSPDGAPVQRWWDGASWTDATQRLLPATSGWPPPPPPRLAGLAIATRIAVALAGAALPLAAGARVWRANQPPTWLGEDLSLGLAAAAGALLVASGVLWAVWQYRVARAYPPGTPRRSPGWQVLSWVIPVGALWLPLQNLADLFRLATGQRPAWLPAWWVLWVSGLVLAGFAPLSPWVGLAGGVLAAAAAPLAWRVVSRLTAATGRPREQPAG